MAAKIEDVARYAGVSTATVSRVFNAKPNVSDDTRSRVRAAIELLGYEGQQRLVVDQFCVVGIVVADTDSSVAREIIRMLSSTLALSGITVVTTHFDGTVRSERRALELLAERRASAVVVLNAAGAPDDEDPQRYSALQSNGTPVVVIGGDAAVAGVVSVRWDDAATIRSAVACLIGNGHRSLGFIARDDEWMSVHRKIDAFEDLHKARPPAARVERVGGRPDETELAVQRLLPLGVTGIICETEWIASAALRAIRRARLRVPQDISVISCEDSRMLAALDPPVTALRQSVDHLSRAVALELVQRLTGHGSRAHDLMFGSELIMRGSVESVHLSSLALPRAGVGESNALGR